MHFVVVHLHYFLYYNCAQCKSKYKHKELLVKLLELMKDRQDDASTVKNPLGFSTRELRERKD